MDASSRFASLLDMLKLKADKFVSAMHALGQVRGSIRFQTDALSVVHSWAPDAEAKEFVLNQVATLREDAMGLGAKMSVKAIDTLVNRINDGSIKTEAEMQSLSAEVENRFVDELELQHVFALNAEEAALYEADGFGAEVHAKFPSVIFELDEASKCMAFGRYTAAVFHWMRAVEVGLRATRLCLGAPALLPNAGRSWGAILTEMRALKTGSPPKWPENDYFSGVYAMLESIMNAWRNSTMHIENKYLEAEAQAICNCVRGFMQKLASRMDEKGLPLA